eukprot:5915273-Prymnesium_polylepis.1
MERLERRVVELVQRHVEHVGVAGVVGEGGVPPIVLPLVSDRPVVVVLRPLFVSSFLSIFARYASTSALLHSCVCWQGA